MHVDGFRFDLASALARELWEVDRLGAFFDIIHQDPVLSQTKLFVSRGWTRAGPELGTHVRQLEVVRDALNRSDRVAFAGDGRPDFKAALMVPPRLRFARGWLADALSERGERFHRFERSSQIADHLQDVEC